MTYISKFGLRTAPFANMKDAAGTLEGRFYFPDEDRQHGEDAARAASQEAAKGVVSQVIKDVNLELVGDNLVQCLIVSTVRESGRQRSMDMLLSCFGLGPAPA